MSGRWLRRAAVVLAALVLALLAARQGVMWHGRERLREATTKLEARIGSLDLASLRLPEISDEDNAARWILQAVAAAKLEDAAGNDLLVGAWRPASHWSPADRDRLCAVVARSEEARDYLARAAATRDSNFGVRYEEGPHAEMPDFIAILRVARLEEAAGKCALLDGDDERFLMAARSVERVRIALCQEPVIIFAVVSNAADRMALRLAADYLEAGYPDQGVLAALREQAASRECEGSLERSLEGEALYFHNSLPRIESLGADSSEPLSATVFRELRHAPFRDWGASAAIEAWLRTFDALDLTGVEIQQLEDSGAFKPGGPGFAPQIYDLLRPNLIPAIAKWKATATSRQLAAVALETAAERLASSAFPPSLELFATSYAGEMATYTAQAGWAEVAASESERLYNERHPTNEQSGVLFRFRITAPASEQ